MYTIAVSFECFDNKREDYIKLLRKEGIVDAIRNEEGCLGYEYYFSEEDKNMILLVEKWEDKMDRLVKGFAFDHFSKSISSFLIPKECSALRMIM